MHTTVLMLTNISLVYCSHIYILYLFISCDFASNYNIIEYGVEIAPTLLFWMEDVTQAHICQSTYLCSHYTP